MSEDIRIVILQRGWVVVGYYSEDGEKGYLERGAVVRIWGTKFTPEKGLGQLAEHGPTPGTAEPTSLDHFFRRMEFHLLTVICTLKCNPESWQSHI